MYTSETMLEQLDKFFLLKPGFNKADMYLGVKLCKTRLHNCVWACVISLIKYVWEAVRNGAVNLTANYDGRFRLPKEAKNPFKMDYDPELDTSSELDPDAVSYYLTVISIQRWMIELRRIDIITKVSVLSSHVALPREEHWDAAVHVIAHVGQRYNSRLVYILHTQK